jgi:peptidoglycan/LPS O-acetylase OafA/YrhL
VLTGIGQRLSNLPVRGGAINGVSLPWVIVLFGVTGALSATGRFHYNGLCLDTWYLFALGVLAYGTVFGGVPWQLFLGVGILMACLNVDTQQVEPAQKATGLAVAALLAWAGRSDRLTTWGRQRIWQYLGLISYSLYLIHGVVGYRILSLAERLTGRSPGWACIWLVIAMLSAVGCAAWMYRSIEAPSIRWARRLKLVRT